MFKNLIGFLAIITAVLAVGYFAMKRADIPYHSLESAYTNGASEFTTLKDGLKVHYRDEGLIEGPTIVLVHGFSASLHTWEGWVRDLKQDHRVISLDLPAHGLTRAPEDYPMDIDQFVQVVDELTDILAAEKFTLAGSSMGGATAWAFAEDHPEKLEGLVLVGASGWPKSEADLNKQPFVFKLLANPTARYLLKDIDMTILIKSGLKDSFVDQSFVTNDMVSRYAALSRAPGHRPAILRLMTDSAARRVATAQIMAGIKVPALILHGDQDNLVPVDAGRKFGATIPGANMIVYENVGHLPQEEITEQSLSDLRKFLSDRVYNDGEIALDADLTSGRQPLPAVQ